MRYVYLLRSKQEPSRTYVGVTHDLKHRLQAHNRGETAYAARYKPWEIAVAVAFADDARAHAFERYLKSGSGRAFAKRHFL